MIDYDFKITGETPYLMHADDVFASDMLTEWRKNPKNKSLSVAGDDRSPAWTWTTYVYHDGTSLAIPHENLMTALRTAGSKMVHKGQTTFKSMSQSGILFRSEFCPFLVDGKSVRSDWIFDLQRETLPFADHLKLAKKHGFELNVRRAKVGTSKHVRVRAMFRKWSIEGMVTVVEPAITESVLSQMFEIAGRRVGLGDWRPSAPQGPGSYGMFTTTVAKVNAKKSA